MSTSLELAQRLEAARLASGLTRRQLTEQAGVSRQAVYRLFKGNDVQVSTLLAVMEVLQLDLATVPRALKRALPELDLRDAAPVPTQARAQATTNAVSPPAASAHVLSAVQRRLAGLKKNAVAPIAATALATAAPTVPAAPATRKRRK
ncbi:helix-turn-helix domain-containing protein [Variovorax sp. RCC_210]|uniref:helix-turn-helix domain-containing protein n=1 Tax=Variovorax sp. RCC_210 TaxID=3239217 RepID=UPI003523CD79